MKNLDIEKLTLGEIATIESLSGQSIAVIGDDTAPKGNALAALVMVAKRRAGEPTFKFNQALSLTVTDAYEILGIEEETEGDKEPDSPAEDASKAPKEPEPKPQASKAPEPPKASNFTSPPNA